MEQLHGPVVSWSLVVIKLYLDCYKGVFFSSSAYLTLEELDKTTNCLMSDNLSDRKTICSQVRQLVRKFVRKTEDLRWG